MPRRASAPMLGKSAQVYVLIFGILKVSMVEQSSLL
jgi:hypothetical protein